jgi:hypothetical protein
MCNSIEDGGHRCTKHAAENKVLFADYEKMSDEQKLAVDEPIRFAHEQSLMAKRARLQANAAARESTLPAREQERAEKRGDAAAKRLLDTTPKKRVAVRVRKDSSASLVLADVHEAVNAEPYVSDEPYEEVIRVDNAEAAKADEVLAAERATIRNPRERAGRHRATPYDDSEEVKVEPLFTDEEALENNIRAGVLGLSMNAFAARQVYNRSKRKGMGKDMRAVFTYSSSDAIRGRELWQQTDERERRSIMSCFFKADAALERTKHLGKIIEKSDARMAELKLRQQTLSDWQKAPHPDGGYGTDRITKKELQAEKHAIAAELGTLREGTPAVRKEHKELVAKQKQFISDKEQSRKQVIALIQGLAHIATLADRERYGQAFAAGLSLGITRHAQKSSAKKAKKAKLVSA